MNEQELMMREKILKREKTDTIIAYFLVVILLACILFMVYIKFIRTEDNTNVTDNVISSVITLDNISTSLTNSSLANRYTNDGATFNTSISDNLLNVSYVKDDVNINLNIPLVGNELQINFDGTNDDIITDIYKEIASIVCVYYGNSDQVCRNTIDSINDSSTTSGIRFSTSGDTKSVYIDITKSVDINSTVSYNTQTIVDIQNTDYNLTINQVKVSNIEVNTSDSDIKFSGKLENISGDSNIKVVVKLYADDTNSIGEETKELASTDTSFEVAFTLDDNLKLDSIKKYSIDIVR